MAAESDLQSIADLDRVIHAPARLMILTYLAATSASESPSEVNA